MNLLCQKTSTKEGGKSPLTPLYERGEKIHPGLPLQRKEKNVSPLKSPPSIIFPFINPSFDSPFCKVLPQIPPFIKGARGI